MNIKVQVPRRIQKRSHVKRKKQLKQSAIHALHISLESLTLSSKDVAADESSLPTLSNARKHGIEVYIEHSADGVLNFTFRDPAEGVFLHGKAALRRLYEKRGWSVLGEDEELEDGRPLCPVEAELRRFHK